MIYGAIIGDIAGSRFEFNNYRYEDFEIFHPDCEITDDSLMTIAIATAFLTDNNPTFWMQEIGKMYPDVSWGAHFRQWLQQPSPKPYNSYGNGAAMRVSPCGWYGNTEDEVIELARSVTEVSHDHPEGIKGATAVALAIFHARMGKNKEQIKSVMADFYPQLDDPKFTVRNIRPHYTFNETCQETVPQAIQAFLESDNFEDSIRKAVSLGGDSDTLAAITGSIAEAYYGVPYWMKNKVHDYLDAYLSWLVYTIERSVI